MQVVRIYTATMAILIGSITCMMIVDPRVSITCRSLDLQEIPDMRCPDRRPKNRVSLILILIGLGDTIYGLTSLVMLENG
ncbi:hypothetical protein D3C87_1695920 [compost metagenome]